MSCNKTKAKIVSLRKQLQAAEKELQVCAQVEQGDVPAPAIASAIKSQRFSFGVLFKRRKALNKPKNRKKGITFTSDRRFSSAKEANQHGRRFTVKHRHSGYQVVFFQSKKANAWINWKTGRTNPVKS